MRSTRKKPHIVIFMPDSWRGDVVGHAGNPAAVTPTLDALIRDDAVSMVNTFAQNPVCTPSRCSFMTGWYTHVRGHRSMLHMLHADEPNLLRRLKQEGYHVWWGGKNDLVAVEKSADFGVCVSEKFYPDEPAETLYADSNWRGEPGSDTYYAFYKGRLTADSSGEPHRNRDIDNINGAIERIRSWDSSNPLCIYLPLSMPHPPYAVEEPWFGMIDRAMLPPRVPAPEGEVPLALRALRIKSNMDGWSEDRWDELRATYYGMIAKLDHHLGRLIDALKDAELYDDTALFCFSDHGDFTGDHNLPEKCHGSLQDCLLRVPFVFKPPNGTAIEPGIRTQMVELLDFYATVEEMLGWEPDHQHFGRSLLPLVADPDTPHRGRVFAETGKRPGEIQHLNFEVDPDDSTGLYYPPSNFVDAETIDHYCVMVRTEHHKYVRRMVGRDELYDLTEAPGERNNLIDDPDHQELLHSMERMLLDHFMKTCDVIPLEQDSRQVQ